MTSALAALANATATFEVATARLVTDPETGNVRPLQETVANQLFLKASPVKMMGYPGMETEQVVYDGYALDPLDPRIVEGTRGLLIFGGNPPVSFEVTGLRMPYGKTGLIAQTLASALGERIELTAYRQDA